MNLGPNVNTKSKEIAAAAPKNQQNQATKAKEAVSEENHILNVMCNFAKKLYDKNVTLEQVKKDKDIDIEPNNCKLFPSANNVV